MEHEEKQSATPRKTASGGDTPSSRQTKSVKLRKRLQDDTDYYAYETITKYIEYLKEQNRVLRFGDVYFDVAAMQFPFVCDTRLCIPCRDGKTITGKRRRRTCCGGYAPQLSTVERKRIDSILPDVCKRFLGLDRRIAKHGGYYKWDENYDRLLTRPEGDWCIFMARDPQELGFHACLLHAYCNEQGLDPKEYKPAPCIMFPLVLLESEDAGKKNVLVTRHTHEVMTLDEDEDDDKYIALDCCKRNPLAQNPLYKEMRDTLVYMFGRELWEALDKALSERRANRDDTEKK
jgi:hypothetical protein